MGSIIYGLCSLEFKAHKWCTLSKNLLGKKGNTEYLLHLMDCARSVYKEAFNQLWYLYWGWKKFEGGSRAQYEQHRLYFDISKLKSFPWLLMPLSLLTL